MTGATFISSDDWCEIRSRWFDFAYSSISARLGADVGIGAGVDFDYIEKLEERFGLEFPPSVLEVFAELAGGVFWKTPDRSLGVEHSLARGFGDRPENVIRNLLGSAQSRRYLSFETWAGYGGAFYAYDTADSDWPVCIVSPSDGVTVIAANGPEFFKESTRRGTPTAAEWDFPLDTTIAAQPANPPPRNREDPWERMSWVWVDLLRRAFAVGAGVSCEVLPPATAVEIASVEDVLGTKLKREVVQFFKEYSRRVRVTWSIDSPSETHSKGALISGDPVPDDLRDDSTAEGRLAVDLEYLDSSKFHSFEEGLAYFPHSEMGDYIVLNLESGEVFLYYSRAYVRLTSSLTEFVELATELGCPGIARQFKYFIDGYEPVDDSTSDSQLSLDHPRSQTWMRLQGMPSSR